MLTITHRYEILRELGSGGMGTVYEALDRDLDQRVALKTLQSLSSTALLRFKNEFRALQDLSHPNLITLGELVEEDGHWFFTMELIEGADFIDYVHGEVTATPTRANLAAASTASLAPTLEAEAVSPPPATSSTEDVVGAPAHAPTLAPPPLARPCNYGRLRHALRQLAEGLTALHDAGLVHRDIKPSNVLVTREGRVVILDFGLITTVDTDEDSVVGTLNYMSPEQILGQGVGPHSDWYAVGVMMYEALTGAYPFQGGMRKLMVLKASQDAPELPVEAGPAPLRHLCQGLLRRAPELRTNGAHVLAEFGSSRAPITPDAFVGRAAEQQALHAAFETALRRERPTVVQVVGEPGIGKSTLVRAFVDELRTSNPTVSVLSSRCFERERLHYKALDGIVDGISRLTRAYPDVFELGVETSDLALLGRLFPVLEGNWVPRSGPPSDGSPRDAERRLEAAWALGTLLTRLAELSPLVLVVEDLHWSDADGVQLLSDTLRNTHAGLLLITITHQPLSVWDETDVEQHSIVLPPLSSDELMRLVDLSASGEVAHDLARHILAESDGNPLFATQMLRAREHLDVEPRSFDEHVATSVERLPEDARVLLEWLAVGGMALPEKLVHRSVKRAGVDFTESIAVLRTRRFSRASEGTQEPRLETYHDRIRSVVVGRMSTSLRERRAKELAEAAEELHDIRSMAGLMANLYREAGEPQRLSEYALRAAHQADRALAFEQAAEWYRTALDHGEHTPAGRHDMIVALASVLSRSGHGREAALAFERAAQLSAGRPRIRLERQAAQSWMVSGHLEQGFKALARIFAELDENIPLRRGAMLALFLLERARLELTRFRPAAGRRSDGETQHLIDLHHTIAGACLSIDPVLSGLCHARALRYALQSGDHFRAARQLNVEALMMAYRDGTPRHAWSVHRQARRMTPDAHAETLEAGYVATEGALEYFSGRASSAEETLKRAEAILLEEHPVNWWQLNNVRFARLSLVRFHGHFDRLEAYFDRISLESSRRGDLYASTTYTRNGLIFLLAKDQLEAARRAHASVTWTPADVGFHFQHYLEWLADTEIGLYQQEVDIASCREGYRRFQRSLFGQSVRMTRCEAAFTWGRVATHAAMKSRGRVERMRWLAELRLAAFRLEREGLGYTRVWSRVLRACEAGLSQPRALDDRLQSLAEAAVDHDMPLYGRIARHRLMPGAALDAHGIVNMDRFVQCFMPLPERAGTR